MTENAPLRRNAAPTAVVTPARPPETFTRVSDVGTLVLVPYTGVHFGPNLPDR